MSHQDKDEIIRDVVAEAFKRDREKIGPRNGAGKIPDLISTGSFSDDDSDPKTQKQVKN